MSRREDGAKGCQDSRTRSRDDWQVREIECKADLHSSPTHVKKRNPELKGQSLGSFCGNCLAVLAVRKARGSGKPEF